MTSERLSSGAFRIHIADPKSYWKQRGFITLAPTVRLAISAEGRPHVTVRLLLPNESQVTAHALPEQGRMTIVFPPGSEADRVSMKRYSGGLTVADVRGSRIDSQGREWFHVYRPTSPAPGGPLVGYAWLRHDPRQRKQAHESLVEHVRTTPRLFTKRPPSRDVVDFFSRMNACEDCHFANKPAGTNPQDWLPLWPTDEIGWYVPLAVMLPELALSTTPRWHDPNASDALVERHCARGPAREQTHPAGSWFRCDDGSVPYGLRDVALGMAQADTYTRALCRSRAYVFERMDAGAKKAFADVMAPCLTAGASSR